MHVPFYLLLLTAGTIACLGCGRFQTHDESGGGWTMPAQRLPPDAVVLEVAFVRVTPQWAAESAALWQEVDEQAIDTELRRRLNANGFRCGLLGTQLPVSIQRLLEQQKVLDIASADSASFEQEGARQHRLQSREGERSAVTTGPTIELLHLFVNDNGSVRGESFSKAQCLFAIRSYPRGDGGVRLELTPEIEHGEPRNRRIGQDGIWRLDFGRDRETFDQLRIDATLAPGRTLLVTCTPQPVFLGGPFFVKGPGESTLLLIRLAQTQKDDLFDSAEQLPVKRLAMAN